MENALFLTIRVNPLAPRFACRFTLEDHRRTKANGFGLLLVPDWASVSTSMELPNDDYPEANGRDDNDYVLHGDPVSPSGTCLSRTWRIGLGLSSSTEVRSGEVLDI